MKRTYITLLAAVVALSISAAAPNGSGSYYSAANGKKGSQLKTALRDIVQTTVERDYGDLWEDFKKTDKRSDGKVWDMYSNVTDYEFGSSAQGANYSGEGDSYNREHSFPKSWFGGKIKPMYTDLHHMYPTDGFVNNQRGNLPLGEVSNPTYSSAGDFSKVGLCSYNGYTGKVFEPNDEYKGDLARTYFYMVTRYEEKLPDWYSKYSESRATINGTTYPGFQTWQLNMLMEWATADPVSDKEIARNNAVYGIQKNRNPFIDYPGLEQYIWGSKKNDAFSYDNYVQPDGSSSGGDDPDPGPGPEPSGDDKTITLTYESFGLSSYDVYDATVEGYGFTVNQGYKGTGNTIQMNSSRGQGILFNSTAIPGLKSITVNVASGNNTYTITTGTSQNPTANSQTGTTGGTYNAVSGDTYFQLKVSGACYFTSIVITYSESGSSITPVDPTFNDLTDVSVDWGSTLTLTKGTTGTTNFVTDGAVTLSSLNEAVVTVDGLTIRPVAVGTTMIAVSTAATADYNAGSVMFPITVVAPEGKETAKPSEGGLLFGESFGNNTGSQRNWSDSYSVKSGISDVYSGITGYTVANVKQTKNTVGSTGSGLAQATQGTDASIIIGPLDVADYSNLSLTYQWKAGSIKATYYTTAYYATSAAGSYTELTGTGAGATTFVERSYSLPAAAQVSTLYLKIVWNTSNTQGIIDEVQLTGSSAGTLTAQLNSYGYGSYCSEYPLDFTGVTDYSAWQVIGVSGETVNFAQVTGKVKGGTGLILKGTPDATIELTSADSDNVLDDNLLVGVFVPTYAEANQYFGLKGNQFVPVAASTVPGGKALLPASLIAGDEVKALSFVFEEDDATSLSSISSPEGKECIYNLAGQRLQKMQRGINIVNGKKILIK